MKKVSILFFLLLLNINFSCRKLPKDINEEVYFQEIQKWRNDRVMSLTDATGWLTLCGLFWLRDGENTIGSDSLNDCILPPGKAPAKVGSLWLNKGVLKFITHKGVNVRYQDSVIKSIVLQSDEGGSINPTILTLNTLSFYVIKRGEQFALRVKDSTNHTRMNFKGLEYFPIDLKWRVEASFKQYEPPKILKISTMVGTARDDTCPGALIFEIDKQKFYLDVLLELGKENFFLVLFGDETNGKETYKMGRQLVTSLPDSNGKILLDFNKAYNFPCVFTEFATCPIPPKQNRLPIRIQAGEKMYRGVEEKN